MNLRAVGVFIFLLGGVASAQTPPPGFTGFIVDHTSYELFDQIPASIKEQALQAGIGVLDRSVGANIVQTGFGNCAKKASNDPTQTTQCTNSRTTTVVGVPNVVPETWAAMPNNVTLYGWPGVGLPTSIVCPHTDGTSLWTGVWGISTIISGVPVSRGMWPCMQKWLETTGVLSTMGALVLLPDYTLSSWSDSVGFFYTNRTGVYDAYDMLAWDQLNGNKFIYASSSIAKGNGSAQADVELQRLHDMAANGRAFAYANNLVFIDVTDIEKFCKDRVTQQLTPGGLAKQCIDWGVETIGGHISYGTMQVLMDKYFVIAFAAKLGWRPNADPPPPAGPSCVFVPNTITSTNPLVEINAPNVSGGQPPVVTTLNYQIGVPFPIGSTQVVATVTDALSRTAQCPLLVTIEEPPPPPPNTMPGMIFTCPTVTNPALFTCTVEFQGNVNEFEVHVLRMKNAAGNTADGTPFKYVLNPDGTWTITNLP